MLRPDLSISSDNIPISIFPGSILMFMEVFKVYVIKLKVPWGMLAHTFNSSTEEEAEEGQLLILRPAWSTRSIQPSRG